MRDDMRALLVKGENEVRLRMQKCPCWRSHSVTNATHQRDACTHIKYKHVARFSMKTNHSEFWKRNSTKG